MNNNISSVQRILLISMLGLLLCFSCIACKTVDASGEVSATISSVEGGNSK